MPVFRSILPGRHIKAAILNHVSRHTSNDYWAPAYFNINSLEAGIAGRGRGGEISGSRENPQCTLIKAVMFYRSHFSMPPLTALEVIKLQASRKEWERERQSMREEKRDREREITRIGGKTDGDWKERKRMINNSEETFARTPLGIDKVNFLRCVCVLLVWFLGLSIAQRR